MVTIVKHEWHSHDRQYAFELGEVQLSEIYPDLDDDEIAQKLADIESGDVDIDEVMNDAADNDVEIEWDFQYDDCWTDRKGGYDITYELGDDDSWVAPDEPPEPTHKCTKCRWKGQSWDTATLYLNEDGSVRGEDESEFHSTKDACPMCDSDVELTEEGKLKEEKRKKMMAELESFDDEE